MKLLPLKKKLFDLWKSYCYVEKTQLYLSQIQWLRKGWCLIVLLHLFFIAFVK